MELQFNLLKPLILLASSWVATTIAIAPSQAATSASSKAEVKLINFSQELENIEAITKVKAIAISESGSLTSEIETEVEGDADANRTSNFSSHLAEGADGDYFGFSRSVTKVLGNFVVEKEPFTFDFSAFLELDTSIDNPSLEDAISRGRTSILLYNSRKNRLLDSFAISGGLFAKDQGDFLKIKASKNFVIDFLETQRDFQGNQETATAKATGQFSRFFRKETHLRLVQVQRNRVNIQGENSVKVPESSNLLALLLFSATGLGMVMRSRRPQRLGLNATADAFFND